MVPVHNFGQFHNDSSVYEFINIHEKVYLHSVVGEVHEPTDGIRAVIRKDYLVFFP